MSALPFVSIIVLNYNGRGFLERCLSSVLQINYPSERYEVILVDNGSTDGSVNFVEQNYPNVKILALPINYGFATGNNKGAKSAKGDILVFLNNDTVVDGNWLCQLIWVITHEKVDICGSRVVFMRQPNVVQYAGGYLHLIGGAIFAPFHKGEPNQPYYIVSSICGASFAIRRHVFEDLGGFDDDFFMYAEEGDLCLRALIYGYRIAYAPYSIVYHYAGGSGPGQCDCTPQFDDAAYSRLVSPFTIYYGNRNSTALLMKSFQTRNLIAGLTFSYSYLFLQLVLLLLNKRSEVTLLIKAGIWPIRNLKTIWKKRVMIQRRRKVSDDWLIRNQLLLPIRKTLKLVMQLGNH
jgi:GT2 family glycosyltransferase